MGRDTLKHVLNQQVQMLEREFESLLRSSRSWNDLQTRSIDVLTVNLHHLRNTVDGLEDQNALPIDTRHELRNRITVIMGYAQLMLHRRAGDLPKEAAACLNKIMTLVMQINTSLDRNKKQARNG